ncbi:MAG TPA: GNAT family N-acetyltransferase [Thermoanaerobaculia bacterium]|nr:GNAT family N-acetyltransferase [Thermoanaerobaculia bacterium]
MKVTNNEKESQFEAQVDGALAVAAYDLEPGRMTLTHTKVPPELEGRGIAGQLAKAALDHARAEGLKVVPECSYMAKYIERHPEYRDLVEE